MARLRETFLRGFKRAGREPPPPPTPSRSNDGHDAELEAALAAALAAGRGAFPDVILDEATFVEHLGRCLASHAAEVGLLAALADCHPADVYLACAAGHGIEAAVAAVGSRELDGAIGAVRKIDGADSFVQEVMQIVRQKLFVAGEGGEPKILSYAGRAPLAVWLAATAQKTAFSLQRADNAQANVKTRLLAAEARVAALEPELEYLRAKYADGFHQAFRHALGRLSDRGRSLLRLHSFGRVTLEQLAGIYGVNDATISRWLAQARRELLEGTGEYMRDNCGVSPDEFPSLARVLQSQLDVSVARLLGSTD